MKTFDADASPAFDLANFDSYCTSLLLIPERIEADYLIFSYRMKEGELLIDDVWLKKIWEITSPSGKDPIKLQVKRGQVYNIRPCTWYSSRLKFQPFENKKDFLEAIAKTHDKYPQSNNYKLDWLKNVLSKYLENTGISL